MNVLCPCIAPTSSAAPIIFGVPKISTALTIKRPSKRCNGPWMVAMSRFGSGGRFVVRLSFDLIPK